MSIEIGRPPRHSEPPEGSGNRTVCPVEDPPVFMFCTDTSCGYLAWSQSTSVVDEDSQDHSDQSRRHGSGSSLHHVDRGGASNRSSGSIPWSPRPPAWPAWPPAWPPAPRISSLRPGEMKEFRSSVQFGSASHF